MTDGEERTVHFVVPESIDDPRRASGGNVYDRHVRDGLRAIGWEVRALQVDPGDAAEAERALGGLPDYALVLIDGLIAGRASEAVETAAARARIVVLAHMVSAAFPSTEPQVVEGEARALGSARRVIATSRWTRSELTRRTLVAPDVVDVALPGSEDAPVSMGTPAGGALLCVGIVAPHKGQDVLIEALAQLGREAEWTCRIAGSLDARPDFVDRLADAAATAGIGDRITMTGALASDDLEREYQRADLLVAPSRVESYGMAIADALRRGIPVVASDVGGVPETVAARAAVLVPPDQPSALADALRRWMRDPAHRRELTDAARRGRSSLPRWSDTALRIASTLAGVR